MSHPPLVVRFTVTNLDPDSRNGDLGGLGKVTQSRDIQEVRTLRGVAGYSMRGLKTEAIVEVRCWSPAQGRDWLAFELERRKVLGPATLITEMQVIQDQVLFDDPRHTFTVEETWQPPVSKPVEVWHKVTLQLRDRPPFIVPRRVEFPRLGGVGEDDPVSWRREFMGTFR